MATGVGLVVALVGLQMKIISDATYAIVLFMTGVTTIAAPPVLRYLFKRPEQQVAVAD